MRLPIRLLLSMALVCIGLQAALQPAAAEGRWFEDLRTRYAHANLTALEDLAKAETLDRLAKDPQSWANFCELVWIYAPYVGRMHAEHAQAAIEHMRKHAETLAAKEGATPHHHLAAAWCTMAGCRARRAVAARPPAEPDWGKAAARMMEFAKNSPQLCVQAATSYTEAAAAKGADADALIAKGRAAIEQALGLEKGGDARAAIQAGWHADLAKSFLARRKKGPAKKCVAAGLEHLAEGLERSRPTKLIQDAHFELAAIDARGKLRVKGAEPRLRTVNVSQAGLELDMPAGSCWKVEEAREGAQFGFTQRILHGPSLRYGFLTAWSQDGRLTLPDGSVVQTNDVKKLAEATSEGFDAHYDLSDIESVSKPKKGRLHKSLDDVYLVIAEGTMQKTGRWARVHVYHFRSKDTRRTYRLTIYEYERDPPEDPIYDEVLESLRVRD